MLVLTANSKKVLAAAQKTPAGKSLSKKGFVAFRDFSDMWVLGDFDMNGGCQIIVVVKSDDYDAGVTGFPKSLDETVMVTVERDYDVVEAAEFTLREFLASKLLATFKKEVR